MSDTDGNAQQKPKAPKGNLLFLTQRIPYPPIKGEKIRPLQILKHLARSYDVHLGCLIDDPRDWEHVNTVRVLCRDAYFAKLDRRRANIACLRGFATGQPLSVEFYRDRGLADWTAHMLRTIRPEVVFICSSNMAPYVLDQPYRGRTCIVDLADVDSEKWCAYTEQSRPPMKWVYRREARHVFALEQRIARETDFSTFVSEAEASLFRSLVPDRAAAIVGVSSGVDFTYFDPALTYPLPYDATCPTFVFTGTMDYPPNVDAVTWFSREMLPLIRKKVPAAQFYIVGSSPSPAVLRLAAIEGVHVTGRVPDVRPYLAHAVACVAPMRIARGIQNKVLEAMAMAKPVIVTPQALEGIEATAGREVILAGDVTSFVDAACRLASSDDGIAIGAAARRRMVEHYSWDHQMSGFDRLLALPR